MSADTEPFEVIDHPIDPGRLASNKGDEIPSDDFGAEATTFDLLGGETWRFDNQGPLVAQYAGADTRDTRYGEDRLLHHFVDDEQRVWDVWGATGLDPLLEAHMGHTVRVIRDGSSITTTQGRSIGVWRVACRDCK